MTGPWWHKASKVWYFRKDTPTDLKRSKDRLLALGLPYKNSVHKSLHTSDKRLAETRYADVKKEVEAVWDHWRLLLSGSPVALSNKDLHALAGKDALIFLKAVEDDPQELSKWRKSVSVVVDRHLSTLPGSPSPVRQTLFELGQRLMGLHRFDLGPELQAVLAKGDLIPQARSMAESILSLEESACSIWASARAKRVAIDHGLILDLESQSRLTAACHDRLRDVMVTLRDRMRGDYSEPEWAKRVPEYTGPKEAPGSPKRPALTFEQVIGREEKRGTDKSDLMAKNRATSVATIRKYRQISKDFSEWRGSDDLTTITLEEVNAWMRSLFDTGKQKRTTVRLKAQALQALCGWAQEQGKRENRIIFPNGLPLAGLPLPEREPTDSAARTFTVAQAQAILKASRKETDVEARWVPWLLAYTGMRVGDAALLTLEDFMSIGETHFIRVRFEKTKSPRWIPLHSDVVREGFIDFVKRHKGKKLFSPRVQANIWEWVNGKVFKGSEKVPPANHGWRHFMESLLRRFDVGIRAGLYLTGRALDKDAEELMKSTARGYGTEELALMSYAAEMEKIKPILSLPKDAERVSFQAAQSGNEDI